MRDESDDIIKFSCAQLSREKWEGEGGRFAKPNLHTNSVFLAQCLPNNAAFTYKGLSKIYFRKKSGGGGGHKTWVKKKWGNVPPSPTK